MLTVCCDLLTAGKRFVNADYAYWEQPTDIQTRKEVKMSSNYEWQKHQINEQLRAHQQTSAEHRLGLGAPKKKTASSSRRSLVVLVLITIGLLVVGFQVSGCTPVEIAIEAPAAAAEEAAPLTVNGNIRRDLAAIETSGLSMAERIQFQDQISAKETLATSNSSPTMSMAERISFQDRISASVPIVTGSQSPATSMAQRISFQDRISAKEPLATTSSSPAMSMAERIRFQDSLSK